MNKLCILFCDLDGVVNSETFYTKRANGKYDDKPYPLSEFDPEAVAQVNRVIEETGAKFVVSSSWRFDKDLKNIKKGVDAVGTQVDSAKTKRRSKNKKTNDERIREDLSKMSDKELKEVVNRLNAQKYDVKIDKSVKELVAKKGIDKNFGARPLRRTIQSLVEDSLAEDILDGKLEKGKKTTIIAKEDKVVIK